MKKGAKKLTILVATGLYSPEIGGPATYTKILEEELRGRKIALKVAPFRGVRRFPKIIRHIAYFFYLLPKSVGVDVIYALDPVSVGFPAAIVSRMMNKRFIVRIPGDYAWEQGTSRYGISESLDTFSKVSSGYPFFVKLLKRIQKFVTSDASIVVVPSKYLKKIVTNWGVPSRSIKVIYNANDAPKNLAEKTVLREMMGFQDKVILSAGRLVSWKGFDVLIMLMKEVLKSHPKSRLIIAGSGTDEEKLSKLISKEKLEKSVFLAGQLDKVTLNNYIKAADLFVLNTFYEGLSHQLLDCMAIGTPVVTTNVGGNPEIIEHNKTGYLVEYNDKKMLLSSILNILNEGKGVGPVVAGAKNKANGFSRERMISNLIKIF